MAIIDFNSVSGVSTVTATSSIRVGSGVTITSTSIVGVSTVGVTTIFVGTGASISSPSSNILTLGTNNIESVRIDSSGYIGINTNNPSRLVEVGAGNTTSKFQLSPHGSGWDTGITSGNIHHHYIDNFRLYSGQIGSGTERFKVDSSGRVFKPSQVNFMARGHTNGTGGSGGRTIIYGTVEHNIGSGYNSSNGIFTAPVAGYYMFGYGIFTAGTAFRRLSTMNINSAAKVEVTTEANNDTYTNLAFSGIFYLNANDTANVSCTADILTGNIYGNFYGYLMG